MMTVQSKTNPELLNEISRSPVSSFLFTLQSVVHSLVGAEQNE